MSAPTRTIALLSPENIISASTLLKLRKEATEHAQLIKKLFPVTEGKKEIWSDPNNNHEYITKDCEYWLGKYEFAEYAMRITPESIFESYVAEWLINNGHISNPQTEKNVSNITAEQVKYWQLAQKAMNFRKFIDRYVK